MQAIHAMPTSCMQAGNTTISYMIDMNNIKVISNELEITFDMLMSKLVVFLCTEKSIEHHQQEWVRHGADVWRSSIWSEFMGPLCYVTNKTRTTRTSAFWDTPCCLMITHTGDSHQIPSQKNAKSKFKFQNFARNFIRDTPSEVAW